MLLSTYVRFMSSLLSEDLYAFSLKIIIILFWMSINHSFIILEVFKIGLREMSSSSIPPPVMYDAFSITDPAWEGAKLQGNNLEVHFQG
jgi:uncharacterized membrane-anchored protein YitT (DUF2179 family)